MCIQPLMYSFDVFDTLLTRVVAHPVDVFRFIQKDIRGKKELPAALREKFLSARVWAEFKSRRLSVNEDVSLPAIYEVIERDYRLHPSTAQWLLSREQEMEGRCLVPIASQLLRVRQLREEGRPVLFISDMYLPSDFIRTQLQRYGAFLPGDRLYISGELGITKGSGKLFKYVLDKEGLEPGQLLHCGDNRHSDVFVPARMGIRLNLYGEGVRCSRTGAASGFAAKAKYGVSLLRARLDLGVTRVA